eukprot:8107335-Karenia_brevis.AAC.1
MYRGSSNQDVQSKDWQRCSEEGFAKMFRGGFKEDAQRKDSRDVQRNKGRRKSTEGLEYDPRRIKL